MKPSFGSNWMYSTHVINRGYDINRGHYLKRVVINIRASKNNSGLVKVSVTSPAGLMKFFLNVEPWCCILYIADASGRSIALIFHMQHSHTISLTNSCLNNSLKEQCCLKYLIIQSSSFVHHVGCILCSTDACFRTYILDSIFLHATFSKKGVNPSMSEKRKEMCGCIIVYLTFLKIICWLTILHFSFVYQRWLCFL